MAGGGVILTENLMNYGVHVVKSCRNASAWQKGVLIKGKQKCISIKEKRFLAWEAEKSGRENERGNGNGSSCH